jgi:glycosyltransferase 2 family protein
VAAAAGMAGLGVLWWRCLSTFGQAVDLNQTMSWYFAGELGKYIPGGVWPVLGRGELAYRKGGVSRTTGYATTLISYAAMCVAAAAVCGALALVLAFNEGSPTWAWSIVALLPMGLLAIHPVVLDPVLRGASRLTRRTVSLTAPRWLHMQSLIATAVPTWLLVGLSSVLIAQALGFDRSPAEIGFAAVSAWIIGFLAVPVPAGAGLRELVFVGLAGLSSGQAVTVAAGARLVLLCVDATGGALALIDIRLRSGQSAPATERLTGKGPGDRSQATRVEG